MERRSVERLDATHLRLDTHLLVGRRRVRVNGVVTVESSRAWHIESDLSVNDRLFGKETVRYRVEPGTDGSAVVAEFTFTGKDAWHHLLFALANRSARLGREKAFGEFATAIVKDYQESKGTPT